MKHLTEFMKFTTYKLYESSEERLSIMLDTIDDMFLDCKDSGFDINYGGRFLTIRISKPVSRGNNMISNQNFNMSEVSDTLYMMISYLNTFSDIIKLSTIKIGIVEYRGGRYESSVKDITIKDIDKDISDIKGIYIEYKDKEIK